MKKYYLLFVLLISILYTRCEELEELYVHNPKGEWVQFTIEKDKHYPKPWIITHVHPKDSVLYLEFDFCFPDSTCVYDIGEDQSDWNKLFGVVPMGWNLVHENSFRFGWRWLNNQLEIGYYNYINMPKPEKGVITHIDIGVVYSGLIIIEKGELYMMLVNKETLDTYEYWVEGEIRVDPLYHILYLYFGGNRAAPHDINVSLKCDQLIPSVKLDKK